MVVVGNNNHVSCDNINLKFEIDGISKEFDVGLIQKISIITTNRGPFEDDIALVISVSDNIFTIKSEHPLYDKLLFDEIGKVLKINYQAIIEASVSCNNAEFVIFAK